MRLTVTCVTPSRRARSTTRASPSEDRQIGNRLDIILRRLGGAVAARTAESFGLLRCRAGGRRWFSGGTRHNSFNETNGGFLVEVLICR